MRCAHCGTHLFADASFCAHCGQPTAGHANTRTEPDFVDTHPSSFAAQKAVVPDDDSELYDLAIGDKRRDYYLPRFAAFERAGKPSLGWHWPAFFFTFWWLLYRKMWGRAALYFFLPIVVWFALGLVAAVSPKLGLLAMGLWWVGIFVLPALFANGTYYRHCQKLVANVRATSRNPQARFALLAKKGGTSNVALILVLVFGLVPGIGIVAAVALPAYQDYTTRAKVSSALQYGKVVASAVGRHYETRRQLPENLGEVFFWPPLPAELRDVQLNTANGTLRLVLASGPASGRTFQLVPQVQPNGRVVWQCESVDMRPGLLPAECR